MGAKKTINLSYDRNMLISIFQVATEADSEGNFKETLLTTYVLDQIDELAKAEEALKEDTTPRKVSLYFELTRNHLLQLNKAEFKYDETVYETITKIVEQKKEDSSDEKGDSSFDDPENDEAFDEDDTKT